MLVLSRKPGEKILIGDKVQVTVVRIGPNTVRLGIDAPRDMNIVREELTLETQEINGVLIQGESEELAEIEQANAEFEELLTAQHEGPLEADGGPVGTPQLPATERVNESGIFEAETQTAE